MNLLFNLIQKSSHKRVRSNILIIAGRFAQQDAEHRKEEFALSLDPGSNAGFSGCS